MNIDLLSKMIKELILDKNEVSLPGVGTFVSELVPSTFSDKGYTINPPYKKLSFRQKENIQDNSVIELYAKSNHIEMEAAKHIVKDFLDEMKELLIKRKVIIFPGLGKLRATKENYFFFVADEELDIYPEGFGLEPVSMKTHEESISEVSETMASLRSILEPEEESADDTIAIQTVYSTDQTQDNMSTQRNAEQAQIEPANIPEQVQNTANGSEEIIPPHSENGLPASEDEQGQNDIEQEQNTTGDNSEQTRTEIFPSGTALPQDEAAPENVEEDSTDQQIKAEASQEQSMTTTQSQTNDAQTRTCITEQMPDNQSETQDETRNASVYKIIKWTLIALTILAVLALAAFMILAHTSPDFIDSILYTPEDLEIIRY